MGWNIKITTKQPIEESTLDELLKELRITFKPVAGRQEWGWSEAVDVRNPTARRVELSGSYSISGKIADAYADCLAQLLEDRHFTVRRWKMT